MAQLLAFPEGLIVGFALVMIRMIAFFFAMPVIGTQAVPVSVKIMLPLVMTVLLYPSALSRTASDLTINEMVIGYAFREVMIGLFLGFVVRMFFFAVAVAGEMMGITSGLSSAQIFNPASGATTGVLEQFHSLMATLFFFGLNGHHYFIEGMVKSFELVPVGTWQLKTEAFGLLNQIVPSVLVMGTQLAMPLLVSMFIANLTMGIVGKSVPQINVLMTSLQVTILAAFLVLLISVPATGDALTTMMHEMAGHFSMVLKAI